MNLPNWKSTGASGLSAALALFLGVAVSSFWIMTITAIDFSRLYRDVVTQYSGWTLDLS
jgi:hypothetical protein